MIFPLRLLNLYRACATENTRYAMTGVMFERDAKGQCRAVATDSKLLVAVEFSEPTGEGGSAFSQMIPRDALKALLLAWEEFKPRESRSVVATLDESQAFRLSAELACGRVAIEGKPVEDRFPPWREILEQPGEPATRAAFDPGLVARLTEVIAALDDPDMPRVTIQHHPSGRMKALAESAGVRVTAMLQNLPG